MSEVIEIPKVDKDHTIFPSWSPVVNSSGEALKPIIRCICGCYCGIGLHHVHADGTVTNSFYHEAKDDQPKGHKGCGWHVWLKLLDYNEGDFPPNV